MNRWMSVVMVAASILVPSMAPAARPAGRGPQQAPAVVVVPEEIVLATAGVEAALERFRTGAVEETAGIEGVIGAVEALTRANGALEGAGQDVVVAALQLEYDTVAINVATLMALADPATGERIGEATTGWLDSVVPRPNSGLEGRSSQCFQTYWSCMEDCSELLTWQARSICGLDCTVDLVGCINQELNRPRRPGGGIGTVGGGL